MITVMGGKLRPVILSTKYFRKFSHKIKDGTIQSESRGLTRELKTLKRTWGRCLLLATMSKKKKKKKKHSQYYCFFCIRDRIHTALMSRRDSLKSIGAKVVI